MLFLPALLLTCLAFGLLLQLGMWLRGESGGWLAEVGMSSFVAWAFFPLVFALAPRAKAAVGWTFFVLVIGGMTVLTLIMIARALGIAGLLPWLPPPAWAVWQRNDAIELGQGIGGGYEMKLAETAYQGPQGTVPEFWLGGETLTVSATGGGVPAFSDVKVTAPTPIEVTSPDCPSPQSQTPGCKLSRTAALPIAWNRGEKTSVVAVMTGTRAEKTVAVACRFNSSPGEISADVLSKFDATTQVSLQVYGSNVTQFTSGEYNIKFEARNWEYVAFLKSID